MPRGDVFRMSYGFSDPHQRAIKKTWLAGEHKEYFDEHHGYLDLESAGIAKVDMKVV